MKAAMNWNVGSGDDGCSSILGGGREAKDSPRMELLGTLDEASSALGMARAQLRHLRSQQLLKQIQQQLQHLMSEVSARDADTLPAQITEQMVTAMEEEIAQLESELPTLTEFVIAGENQGEAALHFARAVVRRAERRMVSWARTAQPTNPHLLRYLNRLSALLFSLARREAL